MQINELIDGIIQKRNAKVPLINSKKDELNKMQEVLDEFDAFKNSVIDTDGNVLDGPSAAFATENPAFVANLESLTTLSVRQKLSIAMSEADKASKRFGRERLNIAVIGKARIGKSQLLQAVSNLSDKVIPAFDDSDCTGAVSSIENHSGQPLRAYLTFKSESQIVKIVQEYLDKLIPNVEKRMVVRTMYDIRDLNIDEIQKRMENGNADNNLFRYLKKYVEHYEEWAPLIAQKELVLDDEKEIQEFVAQNNGIPAGEEGRKDFYKFLAVEICRIECSYDYEQAGKTTLIDTIGFDDNAIGIEDELIKVVNDKSDAVIFQLLPFDLGGGGVPASISRIYDKIQKTCKGKDLDKWLFWLINYAQHHPKTPIPRSNCESTLKTLQENRWAGDIKKIIDVSDAKQVREEFLIPMLQVLTQNIDSIDALYFEDFRNAIDEVKKAYNLFCQSASKMMSSKIGNATNLHPFINHKINEIDSILRVKLKELAEREREKRDVPCKELEKQTDAILNAMRDESLLPSIEEVSAEVFRGQPPIIYANYCNIIRTELTQRFASVDVSLQSLVTEIKNEIAQILINDCRLGTIIKQADMQPWEWVDVFAENILFSEQEYPNLYPAFKNVQKFDFSVKGFLTYEVRACLDYLDPDLTDTPPLAEGDKADNIRFNLDRALRNIADMLTERIDELMNKPNRAFFAFVREFSDKVIYGKDVKDEEWGKLVSGNIAVMWQDEYKNAIKGAKSLEAWSDLLSKLLELNSNMQQLTI